MIRRWSAQSTWMMTFSSRSIMTKRMFCSVYVDDDVFSEVCHDQTMFCVVDVDDDVFSKVNHDQTKISQPSSRRWEDSFFSVGSETTAPLCDPENALSSTPCPYISFIATMSLVKFAAAFTPPPELYRIRTRAQGNRGKPVPIQPVIPLRLDRCN